MTNKGLLDPVLEPLDTSTIKPSKRKAKKSQLRLDTVEKIKIKPTMNIKDLDKAIRKGLFLAWEAGKKQKDTPYDYTLSTDKLGKPIYDLVIKLLSQSNQEIVKEYEQKFKEFAGIRILPMKIAVLCPWKLEEDKKWGEFDKQDKPVCEHKYSFKINGRYEKSNYCIRCGEPKSPPTQTTKHLDTGEEKQKIERDCKFCGRTIFIDFDSDVNVCGECGSKPTPTKHLDTLVVPTKLEKIDKESIYLGETYKDYNENQFGDKINEIIDYLISLQKEK